MKNPSNLVLIPHSSSSLPEMLSLAVAIKGQREYEPLILIHWEDCDNAINSCLDNNISYILHGVKERDSRSMLSGQDIGPQSSSQNGGDRSNSEKSFPSIVKERIKQFFFVQFIYYLASFSRDKRGAKLLLEKLKPECILTVGDRHVGIETALIEAANPLGVPSLIVPFALSDQAGGAAYRLAQADWQNTYGMSNGFNRWLAETKPNWVYKNDAYALLWNQSAWLLAAHIAGILPPDPWNLGGGRSWKMAVESDQARDIFVREGLNPEKLVVVGKPRYDAAARIMENQAVWREKICRALDLDPEKPLLLCSVPQLAEHDLLPWDEHWKEIHFLFRSLAGIQTGLNVILSLHPKSDINQYLPRAEEFDIKIATSYSYDQLIPICDVFVATYSSTVSLAILSRKPTVVIDFDWFDYNSFDEISGVVVIHERSMFVPTLQRLFSDQDYYDQLAAGQAKAARYWGRFDGKATERVLNLIDEYIAKGRQIQKLPRRERRKALPPWSQ